MAIVLGLAITIDFFHDPYSVEVMYLFVDEI